MCFRLLLALSFWMLSAVWNSWNCQFTTLSKSILRYIKRCFLSLIISEPSTFRSSSIKKKKNLIDLVKNSSWLIKSLDSKLTKSEFNSQTLFFKENIGIKIQLKTWVNLLNCSSIHWPCQNSTLGPMDYLKKKTIIRIPWYHFNFF
jgi:hypothetical protein